jgi:hypothetical protein
MQLDFAICVNNEGYEDSVEEGKVYELMAESGEKKSDLVRVADESGENHVVPKELFVEIHLPKEAEKALFD